MAFRLDHVIITVHHLDAAMADFQALGFTVHAGGRHASGTTHNALVCFQDGSYIELLALTGEPRSDMQAADFSELAKGDEGLAGYALLADDLETTIPALKESGVLAGKVIPGRRKRTDGTEIRWLTADVAGGMSPFLIQDQTPRPLRVPDNPDTTRHANGVTGIVELEVLVASLDETTLTTYTGLCGALPWRSSAAFAIFRLQGIRLRLTPALTPDAQSYLAQHRTPLYRLVLLGSAPRLLDTARTRGAVMHVVAETP